jgi:hypothetical protein
MFSLNVSRLLLWPLVIIVLSCAHKPEPPPITKTEMESLYRAGEVSELIIERDRVFIKRRDSDLKIPVMLHVSDNAKAYAENLFRTLNSENVTLVESSDYDMRAYAFIWYGPLFGILAYLILWAVAATKVINGSNTFGEKVLWFFVLFLIPVFGPIAALIGRKK